MDRPSLLSTDLSNLRIQATELRNVDTIPRSAISTPITQSGRTSPTSNDGDATAEHPNVPSKKKKKKKSKKSVKLTVPQTPLTDDDDRPPVLCISRNKHWRYISSYHGPWLQLPIELLDSLLTLNLDPAVHGSDSRNSPPPSFRGSKLDFAPPEPPRISLPPPPPGKATPPPIDPGVFRSVRNIRRLIDEAAELSVRASSGLSAAELSTMRANAGPNGNPWATAQAIQPGANGAGGRSVAMSATRVHRLRALAVQKLAQAYREDEIASSVMVMQGGSVFEDVAERVLRQDPNDADAKYVHFFHEKIPSRQLAESTTTTVLDNLIAANPQQLEYYRTRGIVHCFREEFLDAVKDFTYALKEARAVRKAKSLHTESRSNKSGKRRKNNRKAPPDAFDAADGAVDSDAEPLLKHPSLLDDAPSAIEPQALFLRAAAHLQHAMCLIETEILRLEEVGKYAYDGSELRLSYIKAGKYGGVEVGNPQGPLGSRDGPKLQAYAAVMGQPPIKDCVMHLLRKSLRDHRLFLAHFDTLENAHLAWEGDIAAKAEQAFLLSEPMRSNNQHHPTRPRTPDSQATYTTYHPLLVESHFSVLICQMMLADFPGVLRTFIRSAAIVDGLEGYPIFLPPRSMAQAEFVEILERLAGGWRNGTLPHSLSAQKGKSKMSDVVGAAATTAASSSSSTIPPSGSASSSSSSYNGQASDEHKRDNGASGSSSSLRQPAMPSGSSSASLKHPPHPLANNIFTSDDVDGGDSDTEAPRDIRADAAYSLDCVRILLAPVAKRQRQRADAIAAEKAAVASGTGKKRQASINIPLHGARVEVILAWMAAVHLYELDTLSEA